MLPSVSVDLRASLPLISFSCYLFQVRRLDARFWIFNKSLMKAWVHVQESGNFGFRFRLPFSDFRPLISSGSSSNSPQVLCLGFILFCLKIRPPNFDLGFSFYSLLRLNQIGNDFVRLDIFRFDLVLIEDWFVLILFVIDCKYIWFNEDLIQFYLITILIEFVFDFVF